MNEVIGMEDKRGARLLNWRSATPAESLVSRGAGFAQKICPNCGQRFSVPRDGYNKVATPIYRAGREIPAIWFANVPYSNAGYERRRAGEKTGNPVKQEYQTDRPMTKGAAAEFFRNTLKSLADIARMFRKVPVREEDITECRKCYRNVITDKAQAWRHESVLVVKKDKNGNILDVKQLRVNGNKPLPEEFNGAKIGPAKRTASVKKAAENERRVFWFCTFPAIRGDRGFTMKTDKACTEKEAREWFRQHSGRGNLSGCAVYPAEIM